MITTLLLLAGIIWLDLVITGIDVLVASMMLLIIAYRYERNPRYDYLIYLGVTILGVLSLFYTVDVVESGLAGFSMIHVVMFTGVLPNRWAITKKLKTYRGFYSIVGVLLILPHAWINLFMDRQISLFGVAAMVLMLPLFITSFQIIRKEIRTEEWVKLQKAAYLVYVCLFLHLIAVADWYGKILYAVLMTLYINNKLVKEFRNENSRKVRR